MNAMINYLLEVNVGLLFFMLVYWAVLRNETQFSFKRAYLLSALLGSLIFPLFHFNPLVSTQVIPSIGKFIPTYWLSEIVINGNGSMTTEKASSSFSIWSAIEWTYLIAILFLVALFFYRIISIAKLFANSLTYRWRNYFVSESDESKPTFSFFHFILIGQANQLTKAEKEEILFHESIHIQKLHSLDILLVSIVGIVCWFNPIVRIYKKALVQLHEFEADARAVENKDVDTYCGLLAKVALQSADFPLANHFNNSLTLKRIVMMKTMKHKIQNWKVAALVAIVPLFFFAVACQEQFKKEENISVNSELLPQQVKDELKSLEKYYDDLKVLEVNEENKKTLDELGYYNGKPAKDLLIILSGTGAKDGVGYVIIGKAKSLKRNESKLFDYVDEKATPIFGLESLYKDVSYTLQYPKSARERGIEGKVFIEFVIQTNGEMSDFKVVKGIDDSIDTEALRALMQINTKWRPAIHQGEIVKMKMVLPIVFKLDGSEKKGEASTIKEPVLDELVAVGSKIKK
jgi:TonB family protein